MNVKRLGMLGLLALTLLLASVGRPVEARSPAQETTPAPETNVLFQDDFSDPDSGWAVSSEEQGGFDSGSVGYKSGVYFVISTGRGLIQTGGANRFFDDVVIDVDATQVSAPPNNHNSYGVGCRVQSFGGYYMFITTTPTQAPIYVLEEQANALLVEGIGLQPQGDYQRMLQVCSEALSLFRQTGNRHNEASALQLLGMAYLGLSDYDQALAYLQQALAVVQESGDPWGEARMLSGIGDVYGSLGRYEQALAHYQGSLTIDREIDEQQGQALTLGRIGVVYLGLSDYEQALVHFQQSLSISWDAETLGNIGNVYERLGDHEQALTYYEQALPVFETLGHRPGVVATLGNIGNIHLDRDDPEQALVYYQQALDMLREIGDRAGEAATLNNIGLVHAELSDNPQALAYHQQALSIQEEIHDRAGEAAALNNIGSVYEGLSDYEQALLYYQRALPIWQEIGDRWGETITLANIGRIYELEEDDAEALEFYMQSIAVREAIRAGVRVQAFKTALAGQDAPVYQRAVRILVGMGRTEEAFNLAERSRARAFLDAMGNGRPGLRQGADADLLRQEETLRGELAALESGLVDEKSKPSGERNQQVTRSIESQLSGKQQEYEELLARLQLTNPELASLVTIPATTVTNTQALLDDKTTLVAYYLTDNEGLAFVLTRDDYQVVELPAGAQEIAGGVESFRSLGLANLDNPHPRSLGDLYAWLVAPLAPFLNTPGVGIIPHQELHYVPFAALSDGEYFFGEQFILFYVPSASTIPFIQAKTGRDAVAPLVLGDPQVDSPDLPRLDHAAREAELVADLFGAEPLLGAEASEAALKTATSGAGVVHLATHGGFNAAAPLFSRLWLAPAGDEDGRLNVHEVYGLDLDRADLVVLSACQTQLGELSRGDEVVGLNRAFLYGAPTVMGSLWPVDDEATGALMVRFYTHLLAGMGKAEALQAAQNEVRTDPAHPEWAHPYYWAAFTLNGDAGGMSATMPTATSTLVSTVAPTVTASPTPAPTSMTREGSRVWVVAILLAAVLLLTLVFVAFARLRSL